MAQALTPHSPTTTIGEDGREQAMFPIGDLEVFLKAPIGGQIATLRRIAHLLESEDPTARGQGCTLFLDIADTLVADAGVLHQVYEGMATERILLEDYADGLVAVLRHFLPVEEVGTATIKPTRRQSTARASTGRKR